MFNKAKGEQTTGVQKEKGVHNVLINAKTLNNANQMKLVEEIRALYGKLKPGKHGGKEVTEEDVERYAKGIYTRKELRDAHGVLRGRRAAPYFISKNVACKVTGQHGMYNVAVLKLSAAALKATDAEAPAAPKAKGKKEASKPKKGASGASKGKKAPKEIEAPATEQQPEATA